MPRFWNDLLVVLSLFGGCLLITNKQGVSHVNFTFLTYYLASNTEWLIFRLIKGIVFTE